MFTVIMVGLSIYVLYVARVPYVHTAVQGPVLEKPTLPGFNKRDSRTGQATDRVEEAVDFLLRAHSDCFSPH
jgi:hypothetical protein